MTKNYARNTGFEIWWNANCILVCSVVDYHTINTSNQNGMYRSIGTLYNILHSLSVENVYNNVYNNGS
jgi:hypothetical protein